MHELDDLEIICDAAKRNMGTAMVPRDMLVDGMQALTIKNSKPFLRKMYAVYPSRRLLPARVRNLIDFMVKRPTT